MSKKDWDSLLGFNGHWLFWSILWRIFVQEQPTSYETPHTKASEKTIFMQTNNINHQKAGITFFDFVLCKKSVNTYKAVTYSVIPDLQIVFNANESKACICVLGRYRCSSLHFANKQLTT